MAWLAGALGAIGGGASEGMGSAAQYQASKHERNIAWKRAQQWELIAPSLRMAGLREAGLNPILAATEGFGGGPANVQTANVGGAPHFDPDPVGRVISGAKQAGEMKPRRDILDAQSREAEGRAEIAAQEARIRTTDADLLSQFGYAQKRLELEQQFETIRNLGFERDLASARTGESRESAARLGVDRLLMQSGVAGAQAMEGFYQKNPWARVVREFGGGSLIGTGAGVGAAAGGYLFGRGGERRAHPNENFGALVPGKPKRGKK